MPKIEIDQKRPLDATPERALAMFNAGVKQVEMAKIWGISPGRVSHLIAKARKRVSKKPYDLSRASEIALSNENSEDRLH